MVPPRHRHSTTTTRRTTRRRRGRHAAAGVVPWRAPTLALATAWWLVVAAAVVVVAAAVVVVVVVVTGHGRGRGHGRGQRPDREAAHHRRCAPLAPLAPPPHLPPLPIALAVCRRCCMRLAWQGRASGAATPSACGPAVGAAAARVPLRVVEIGSGAPVCTAVAVAMPLRTGLAATCRTGQAARAAVVVPVVPLAGAPPWQRGSPTTRWCSPATSAARRRRLPVLPSVMRVCGPVCHSVPVAVCVCGGGAVPLAVPLAQCCQLESISNAFVFNLTYVYCTKVACCVCNAVQCNASATSGCLFTNMLPVTVVTRPHPMLCILCHAVHV